MKASLYCLFLVILAGIVVASECDTEFDCESDYLIKWGHDQDTWDLFVWDPYKHAEGDPTKYDLGWYPLQPWEYMACLADFSTELGQKSLGFDLAGRSKVYGLTMYASATRKNLTIRSANNITFESTHLYEYEWYVQPVTGTQKFTVYKQRQDGELVVLQEETVAGTAGSARYVAEYANETFTHIILKEDDQSLLPSIPIRDVR